jgi:autotransporter-associated beta strand protein
MRTIFRFLGALSALLCATAQAQLNVTTNTATPAIGAYDQYYLPGPVDESAGAMTSTGTNNASSGANDSLTYVAGDQASKGQSFTTGSNPAGYTINSITVRHILWTNFLSNGTWMSIPSGSAFLFRFGTLSGANITSLLDTNATYSGSSLSMSGGSGTGIYFTFDLSGAGLPTLSPNTTYFFEIASAANPPYFELHNTRTNGTSYTNGTAFYGDTTAALDQSGVVNLPPFGGEFAFDAALAAVGAPSVVAVANPNSASAGQAFTITATVTPGAGTVTNVSANLSALGGSAAANLVLSSGNVYTNTFTVPIGAPLGNVNLTVAARDNASLVGTYGVAFEVQPNNRVWTGGSTVDSNWSTANNWQNGLAPSLAGNNVVFAGTTGLLPNLDNDYSVSSLVFSNTAGSYSLGSSAGDSLTIGSGGLINDSANPQMVNIPIVLGAAQTMDAAAGNLAFNSNVTGGVDLQTTGAGIVTFGSPGTNTIGDLDVNSGQLNITAGTVNVTDATGNSTMIENNAVLTVSGGTLNIYDGGNGWFPIGVTAGATGTVVVDGGALNVLDHWGTEVGNNSGSGVLTINSGSFENDDIGGVGLLIADATSTGGTINLNGGALIVNSLSAGAGAGGNFYFNGGTLKPLASNAGFWNESPKISASIRNGGAVVDTTNFDVTIAQPLLHSTVAGDNATDGGLTKLSAGTLTLSGGYSYTGPTVIMGGALNLSSGLGVPATGGNLVVSNAILALDASSGVSLPATNVVLDDWATVTITDYPSLAAINATGNLLVQSDLTLNIDYGVLSGDPTSAAITVAGSISVDGTNNVINLSGSGFVLGQFPLIKYGAGSLPSLAGLKLGAFPPGVNGVLVNNTANRSLDLNITFIGQSLIWYGTNNLWDINTTYNWNTATSKYLEYGTSPTVYGDLVTFDDTLYHQESTNVILTATLHPSEITENSSLPYSFIGAGSLAGSGSLSMNGSGSLTLGTANSYTGGTFVNAGTLMVTNDSALGASSGALTLAGGTIQFSGSTASTRAISVAAASVVDVVPGALVQFSGLISGAGDLSKIDGGALTLADSGTNAIGDLRVSSGQFTLASGVLNVTDAAGTATRIENAAALVVTGGTLNILDGGNGWFPIGVTAGATGTVTVAGGTIYVRDHWGTEVGNESGAGVLTINSGSFINNDIGGIGLLIADSASTGGTINLNGGALIVNLIAPGAGAGGNFYFNGGTLKPLSSTAGFWNDSTKITASVRNGGAVVDTAGYNVTIGQPLVHSALAGDQATDGGLIKTNSGTLTLAGADSYTGNTRISGGILELAQSFATLATNSSVLIASGAQLQLDSATLTNVVTSLELNGLTKPAGLYGSANSSGFITGAGRLLVLTGAVGPSGPATLTNSLSAGVLSLSWPASQGWRLQVQTNSLSTGLSTNWVYVTDGTVSSTNITVDSTKAAMFYRLTNP